MAEPGPFSALSRRDFLKLGLAMAALAGCSRIPGATTLLGASSSGVGAAPLAGGPSNLPSGAAQALLAASRLTFGPVQSDLDWILTHGVDAFIEEQLASEQIDDSTMAPRLQGLATLAQSPAELAAQPRADVLHGLQQATLLRAVYSRRQLYELMVDFWSNHFNIYFAKNADYVLKTVDDREVIRQHALGNFRDLLGASAHSPAMLVFLDNNTNRKGQPNENYARELMELHTISVDGGYTQQDVSEVARAFTGWSVYGIKANTAQVGTFHFIAAAHDQGAKQVLGMAIPANGGEKDGELVLDRLASHPQCGLFLSAKLARRFIADTPPAGAVQAGAAAFQKSQGDLRATLGAILHSPEFKTSFGQKVKRPFEFVASALRALRAQTDGSLPLLNQMARLGQPLFLWAAPNGYPDSGAAWINSGALLARWNFALALANGGLKGAQVDLASLVPPGDDAIAAFSQLLLGAQLPEDVVQTLRPFAGPGKLAELAALLLSAPLYQQRG